jgi:predicted Zn-dependent protease
MSTVCCALILAPAMLLSTFGRGLPPRQTPQQSPERPANSAPAARSPAAPDAAVTAAAAASDPVLQAMQMELDRSKAQLKMEDVLAPFYIEYRVVEGDDYQAQAEFGSLEHEQRVHFRLGRVVVRVGSYHLDSYYQFGTGATEPMPLEDDSLAIRHALWLATDNAYKGASQALTEKEGLYKRFNMEQAVDDFAHATPVLAVGPLAKLDFDPARWRSLLESATALYRNYPGVQTSGASAHFVALNTYFVNSEGTVLRSGKTYYEVSQNGSTQAADGMRLDRSPGEVVVHPGELPSAEKFTGDMREMFESLLKLRDAAIVEEEYRGPVLFSADAAVDVVEALLGTNVLGRKPSPNAPARTLGAFASSYKSRILPEFLSLVDDPTTKTFRGKSLVGSYEVDDEGVRAVQVDVVDKGVLLNYLIWRRPIRDFPQSNGHGRFSMGGQTDPGLGVLMLRPAQPLSKEELRSKLIELCRQQDKPYGYYVDTLGGRLSPRVLFRVWVNDGHEELVRGAAFQDLDTRSLRNDVLAAGNDFLVSNRVSGAPHSLISPSILFGELVVKRADASKEKLPEYPAPAFTSAH